MRPLADVLRDAAAPDAPLSELAQRLDSLWTSGEDYLAILNAAHAFQPPADVAARLAARLTPAQTQQLLGLSEGAFRLQLVDAALERPELRPVVLETLARASEPPADAALTVEVARFVLDGGVGLATTAELERACAWLGRLSAGRVASLQAQVSNPVGRELLGEPGTRVRDVVLAELVRTREEEPDHDRGAPHPFEVCVRGLGRGPAPLRKALEAALAELDRRGEKRTADVARDLLTNPNAAVSH